MADPVLSAALLSYIWGDRSLPWPSQRPESLRAEQRQYLPILTEIIAVAFEADPMSGSLHEVADRAESIVRSRFDLSDEAIRAVGNLFAYQWK